jgi:hypothetical protein
LYDDIGPNPDAENDDGTYEGSKALTEADGKDE